LLRGTGNVRLEDQAIGPLVNVDRRRVSFPRHLEALLLILGRPRFAGPRSNGYANHGKIKVHFFVTSATIIRLLMLNGLRFESCRNGWTKRSQTHRNIRTARADISVYQHAAIHESRQEIYHAAGPVPATTIRRGRASSAFGMLTVRIPSAKDAATWALSTRS